MPTTPRSPCRIAGRGPYRASYTRSTSTGRRRRRTPTGPFRRSSRLRAGRASHCTRRGSTRSVRSCPHHTPPFLLSVHTRRSVWRRIVVFAWIGLTCRGNRNGQCPQVQYTNHDLVWLQLWHSDEARTFIKSEYPAFLSIYDGLKTAQQRSDALSYFLVRYYGGIYVDMHIVRPTQY